MSDSNPIIVIPIHGNQLTAHIAGLDRLIESGGPVDQIRSLLSLRDTLHSRAAAFCEAHKIAEQQAASAAAKAAEEGNPHPEWHADFAREHVYGSIVLGWITGPGLFDHYEADGSSSVQGFSDS